VHFSIILNNYSDSSVLLTSYYGNKIKLVDTATMHAGVFNFSKTNYPGGMYMLASPSKNKLIEFIINNESGFTLQTDTTSPGQVAVNGSIENKLFFKHLQLRNDTYRQAMKIIDMQANEDTQPYQIEEAEAKLDSLKKGLEQEEKGITSTYPDLFITEILKANKEIKIPLSIADDSLQSYLYYKEHFWDNLQLSDDRFLRTPIIDQKLQTYFDRVIFLDPDSTIAAIDKVVSLARPSDEVVSYLLWYFIAKYQNPQYMGFDAVFVHLVDQYFLKEEVRTPLKEYDFAAHPLQVGDFLYIYAGPNGNFEHMLTVSYVDEAGRGPAIGPLVITALSCNERDTLASMGVKDSKMISPSRRLSLLDAIIEVSSYATLIVPAKAIDIARETMTMNRLEILCFSSSISSLLKGERVVHEDLPGEIGVTVRHNLPTNGPIVVDAADVDEKRFGIEVKKELERMIGVTSMELISRHKADRDDVVVGAASIVAKVTRDREIESISDSLGENVGSGYPSDPNTRRFLENWVKENRDLPPHCRRSWETCKRLIRGNSQTTLSGFS